MKKVYLYFYGNELHFYSTPKKAFMAAKENGESMHKTFAVFKRWLIQDGLYKFGNNTNNEIQIRPLL